MDPVPQSLFYDILCGLCVSSAAGGENLISLSYLIIKERPNFPCCVLINFTPGIKLEDR